MVVIKPQEEGDRKLILLFPLFLPPILSYIHIKKYDTKKFSTTIYHTLS